MTASVVDRYRVRRSALVVWGLVVAVLLVGCDVEFSMSTGDSDATFDATRLGEDIAADLSAQLAGGFEVDCPEGQPAEPGLTFECEAVDDLGDVGIIGVTVVDEDGNVDWELLEVIEGGAATGSDDAAAVGEDEGPGAAGQGDAAAAVDEEAGAAVEGEDDDAAASGGGEDARAADPGGSEPGGTIEERFDGPIAPEDVPRPADVPDDWVVFAEPGAGFTLWHPPDWTPRPTGDRWSFNADSGIDAFGATLGVAVHPTRAAGGVVEDKWEHSRSILSSTYEDTDHELLTDGIEVEHIRWQVDDTEVPFFVAVYAAPASELGQLVLVAERDSRSVIELTYTAPAEVFGDLVEDVAMRVLETVDTAPLH